MAVTVSETERNQHALDSSITSGPRGARRRSGRNAGNREPCRIEDPTGDAAPSPRRRRAGPHEGGHTRVPRHPVRRTADRPAPLAPTDTPDPVAERPPGKHLLGGLCAAGLSPEQRERERGLPLSERVAA